jgi:cysteine desulfurase/selenocysteine lyase
MNARLEPVRTPGTPHFDQFRRSFPGTERMVYCDAAARGLMSMHTRAAIDAYLDGRVHQGGDKAGMFDTLERARARFAQLVNASPDEVAITKNVSEGLNAVGMALPWARGDEIVLCSALEHPNNVYPWRHLARRAGVVIRDIPAEDGHLPVAAMAEAVSERTRMVVAATTTFAPGYRCEFSSLSAACRRHDAFLLVDAVQSAGILHTDMAAMGVDALAVSTQKGLLGTYGFGFLYCRMAWAERLEPAYLARFGVDLGEAHEASLGGEDYRYAAGARRFDLGNYNYIGATAADASLGNLLTLGTPAIETHVTALARRLAEGLTELDLGFTVSEPGPALANMVTVGNFGAGQHDSADDDRLTSLDAWLRERTVVHSIRRGLLRFALHAYNDRADVERLIRFCAEWRRRN